jgi:hypothetical protein
MCIFFFKENVIVQIEFEKKTLWNEMELIFLTVNSWRALEVDSLPEQSQEVAIRAYKSTHRWFTTQVQITRVCSVVFIFIPISFRNLNLFSSLARISSGDEWGKLLNVGKANWKTSPPKINIVARPKVINNSFNDPSLIRIALYIS